MPSPSNCCPIRWVWSESIGFTLTLNGLPRTDSCLSAIARLDVFVYPGYQYRRNNFHLIRMSSFETHCFNLDRRKQIPARLCLNDEILSLWIAFIALSSSNAEPQQLLPDPMGVIGIHWVYIDFEWIAETRLLSECNRTIRFVYLSWFDNLF